MTKTSSEINSRKVAQKRSSKKKDKGGRPKEDLAEKVDFASVERWAANGMTDIEVARVCNVSERTLRRWKKDSRFVSALKVGRGIADSKVQESLYKRAIGFEYVEVTEEERLVGGGDKAKLTVTFTKTVTKFYPPDVKAGIHWLNHRQPNDWGNTKEITGADAGPLGLSAKQALCNAIDDALARGEADEVLTKPE